MEYGRENVVQVIATENWSNDPSVWATEDDYRTWNNNNNNNGEPPSKKTKNSQDQNLNNNRSKAIGKMFFKTKLCCKFRAGTCPYVTNCNFAHAVEELRRPPPNWQDIVAARDEDGNPAGPTAASPEQPREEFQIPSVGGFAAETTPRSYKGRHCKRFYTEEGCPYGEACTFLHDEHSKNRESVAISLGPGGGYGGGGGGGNGGGGGAASGAVSSNSNSKPSNWKTRICNKWEMTGYCPFGAKCHFAHGQTELHRYGGGLVETEARDSSSVLTETKQPGGVPPKSSADTVVMSVPSVPPSDVYHIGVASQRSSIVIQRPPQRAHQKWKGPDKISRIYGDWIDDIE